MMTYLRSIYPLDWYNFMERLKEDGKTTDGKKFDRLQASLSLCSARLAGILIGAVSPYVLPSACSCCGRMLNSRLCLQGLDPATITEDDFGEGGALYGLQMELLLWASYRGQLLARTVRGECPLPSKHMNQKNGLDAGLYSSADLCAGAV